MNEQQNSPKNLPDMIIIGIDWADRQHAVCLIDPGDHAHISTLKQSPKDIDAWVADLQKHFPGKTFAVAIEQSKGPLINALMKYDRLVLYPINPKQLSRYRDAIYPSGSKNDPGDAKLLAQFLAMHIAQLRPWKPDTETTRKLANFTEIRRKIVKERGRLNQQLSSALKWSGWSAACYRHKRDTGYRHQAAVRALAYKWIRIIFRLWKTNTTYNEAHYIAQLKRRNSPLVKLIENT